MHELARTYGQRPAAFLELAGWEAYQIDLATLAVGRHVETKLAERTGDGRPAWTLEQIFDEEAEAPAEAFANPSALGLVRRKVAIPESGIW